MNAGKYIFSQLVSFLPKRVFDGIVKRHEGDKWVKHFTCWNQLLVMMFGQLAGCDSLREVAAIIDAIKSKSQLFLIWTIALLLKYKIYVDNINPTIAYFGG